MYKKIFPYQKKKFLSTFSCGAKSGYAERLNPPSATAIGPAQSFQMSITYERVSCGNAALKQCSKV